MLYNAAEKAEPSLLRRRRQLIDHLKLIDDMDKECVRYYLDKQTFHVEHSNATEIRIQSEHGRQSRIHKGEAGTHRLREMKQEYDQIDLENRKLELAVYYLANRYWNSIFRRKSMKNGGKSKFAIMRN